MNNTIIRAMVVCTALASGAAFADGVPLITAGPTISAKDPVRQIPDISLPEFVKLHPIVINKAAFNANVLTVTIDGVEHRFVGSIQPRSTAKAASGASGPADYDFWRGTEAPSGTLSLTRHIQSGRISGTIFLPPARQFTFRSDQPNAMVERDINKAFRPVPLDLTPPGPIASAPKGQQ